MKMTIFMSSDDRLDIFFKSFGFETRSEFSNAIKDQRVLINDKKTKASYKLAKGDVITIKPDIDYNKPKNLDIKVLYEDENILVIDKPAFIASHGAKSYKGDSVVNWLLYYGCNLSDLNGDDRPGIVHRLDADTSGALIIAKNNITHQKLQDAFRSRSITKEYLAIVNGCAKFEELTIEDPIARGNNPTKMAVVEGGRSAVSYVKTIDKNEDYSFLKVKIATGRTHQIRVHLSHHNLPIVGDKLYGLKKEKIIAQRQMLHAYHLGFDHPITGKRMDIYIDPPEDFKTVLAKTGLDKGRLGSI
ncbi:RluA family pseudouridine synthase [uncultured Ezakiella sp.]|uniref:RluA family pseudouridine synthase n=1 Tax=uncultured Ezakiella sp. TaxID=1637529 RepID=UPI0025F0F83E|nr:RluA family pseudouridine synthase [uncultured Ezakiella sp.]